MKHSRPKRGRPVGQNTREIKPVKRSTGEPIERVLNRKKKKEKRNIFFARIRAAILILICIAIVVTLGVGAGMYASVSTEIDAMNLENATYNFASVVYADDNNGNFYEIERLQGDEQREWVDSDKISDIAKDAAVSIEDERFYKHNGIDLKRTFGATVGWAVSKITKKSPSYGGSTITQQVIKNITNEKDKTATRKIKEMMRAVALEKKLTKDEILTLYLNIVYFGNQGYGIEAASKIYFNKSASDLTLPQAAMIVGITQAPTKFNPYKNPDNALAKRNTVLKKMYDLGKITEEDYDKAVSSDLGVAKKGSGIGSNVYNYFIDQVISDVLSDLQTEKGYSQKFAEQQLFNGGFKIYTTIDPSIQAAIDEVYSNKSNFPGAGNGTQSAMVVMDPYTGEIKGMAGGVGKKTQSRGLNRASQTPHQPGSSIKPISVYSAALQTGKITAASIIKDSQLTIGDWSPKNSYTGFKGDLSVRKAIEISANIPAVRTLQEVGIDTSYDFAKNKYHMNNICPADKAYSPLSLGGLTSGVTTKEMAAAYSVFVNEGIYTTPHTYTKVLDNSGKVLLEYTPKTNRVLSKENAFIMTSFLSEVVNGSAGTGRGAKLANMPTYGKTGTTNSNYDKWFVGFTPYYVGAVWYGYDSNPRGLSTNASVSIWKKVMTKIHENLPSKSIEAPSGIESASICQRTGKLASKGCAYAKTEYFARGTVPTKYCNNSSGNYKSSSDSTEKKTTDKNSTDKKNTDKNSAEKKSNDGGTDDSEIEKTVQRNQASSSEGSSGSSSGSSSHEPAKRPQASSSEEE